MFHWVKKKKDRIKKSIHLQHFCLYKDVAQMMCMFYIKKKKKEEEEFIFIISK